ncbi:MAG TPA: response regulator [Lachnospiraceae bacterium]|nr:response regulator [Lachnospiraceae bacterium]
MKLFIADDEMDVREGIRCLLDWQALGFTICGEGKNGEDTLEKILRFEPDVVLIDIRMPRISGLEVIKRARENNFHGRFIILSGYSDFAYAQEAIHYGVTNYLTKPIDEDDLKKAVLSAKADAEAEQAKTAVLTHYKDRARDSILREIIMGQPDAPLPDAKELMLDASVFQVILYTNYKEGYPDDVWNFAEILRLANHNHNSLDFIKNDKENIILLKGDFAISRFQELLEHYISMPQKGSPLDSLFLVYGKPVSSIESIHLSHEDAAALMKRRFFCRYNQHVLSYNDLPEHLTHFHTDENLFSEKIAGCLQTGNRRIISSSLEELKKDLYYSDEEVPVLRHYLSNIMAITKSLITHAYRDAKLPFAEDKDMIHIVEESNYLYEIMDFFTIQLERCFDAIGSPSRESIIDGILDYIERNYQESLKLAVIAELFGYNSSYLGKLFYKVTGKTFNVFLDEVRIENAKKLLSEDRWKIYEIAQMTGFGTVDYFHKKFRKYTGTSPAEYRKNKLSL